MCTAGEIRLSCAGSRKSRYTGTVLRLLVLLVSSVYKGGMTHYVGGPLDGQRYPRRRGRLTLFRRDDGVRLSTYHGYRIFSGHPGVRVTSPPSGYALWGPDNLYVHSSVWQEVTGAMWTACLVS